MKTVPKQIQAGKYLFLAGCFDGQIQDTTWFIEHGNTAQPNPAYTCNAEETDTRIWLHCRQSASMKILVVSPDTDIFHIGLPLDHKEKEIVIQINPYTSKDQLLAPTIINQCISK